MLTSHDVVTLADISYRERVGESAHRASIDTPRVLAFGLGRRQPTTPRPASAIDKKYTAASKRRIPSPRCLAVHDDARAGGRSRPRATPIVAAVLVYDLTDPTPPDGRDPKIIKPSVCTEED